jgi:hypothetical protein
MKKETYTLWLSVIITIIKNSDKIVKYNNIIQKVQNQWQATEFIENF